MYRWLKKVFKPGTKVEYYFQGEWVKGTVVAVHKVGGGILPPTVETNHGHTIRAEGLYKIWKL